MHWNSRKEHVSEFVLIFCKSHLFLVQHFKNTIAQTEPTRNSFFLNGLYDNKQRINSVKGFTGIQNTKD